jgi:hypothetical protein
LCKLLKQHPSPANGTKQALFAAAIAWPRVGTVAQVAIIAVGAVAGGALGVLKAIIDRRL